MIDKKQYSKYKLEVGVPLSLIWLLLPLKKISIKPSFCFKQEKRLKSILAKKKGVILIGYHSLLLKFFNLYLIENIKIPVTLGVRETENIFGCKFENKIQPSYMFLKKIQTALRRGELVAALIDTPQLNNQTVQIQTRFGIMNISKSILHMAVLENATIIFVAPKLYKGGISFDSEFIENPNNLESVIYRYQLFLA